MKSKDKNKNFDFQILIGRQIILVWGL